MTNPAAQSQAAAWRRRSWLTCVLVLMLAAGSLWSLRALGKYERETAPGEKLYFPSGRFLRESTLGFREVAADYVWFQTVQYYGSYRKGENDLNYFRGLVDAVTRLDTRFIEAFRFASLVLALDMGDVEGGIDCLKRGILANPDAWILPFEIGFIHYIFTRDYSRAAVWFEAAAASPQANDFCRRFAAFCRKRAGDLEVSLVLWRQLYDTTSNPHMQDLALRMIAQCEQQLLQRRTGSKGSS